MSTTLENEMKNRDSRKFLMDLVDLKSIQDPELILSISDIRELLQTYA